VRILALDPGRTTGFCYGSIDGNKLVLDPDQFGFSLAEMYKFVWEFALTKGNHVVYEDFQYRNASRMGIDLYPVKVIGVIELVEDKLNEIGSTFHRQQPSQAKFTWPDDRLKGYEIYKPGKPHGRDAERHLLHFIEHGAGSGIVDFERLASMKVA